MRDTSISIKNEGGYVGAVVLILIALLIYFILHLLLLFLPEPLLEDNEIIYAETNSKVYPGYKDTLYKEFEEAESIPFNELIVTIVPVDKKEHDNFDEITLITYPVVDISTDILSSLGLDEVIKEEYRSVPMNDLMLLLTSTSELETLTEGY